MKYRTDGKFWYVLWTKAHESLSTCFSIVLTVKEYHAIFVVILGSWENQGKKCLWLQLAVCKVDVPDYWERSATARSNVTLSMISMLLIANMTNKMLIPFWIILKNKNFTYLIHMRTTCQVNCLHILTSANLPWITLLLREVNHSWNPAVFNWKNHFCTIFTLY